MFTGMRASFTVRWLDVWAIDNYSPCCLCIDTIQQVIRYTYATVGNKASNKVALANAGRCGIQKASLIWYATSLESFCWSLMHIRLGTKAFHTIFSQKPTAYGALIALLSHGLKKSPHSKRLRRLVIEAGAMIAQLSFWKLSCNFRRDYVLAHRLERSVYMCKVLVFER